MKDKLHTAFLRAMHIEDDLYKLSYVSAITAIVAERISDNDSSTALWAASDMLNQMHEHIENQITDLRTLIVELRDKAPEGKKRGRPAKKASKK